MKTRRTPFVLCLCLTGMICLLPATPLHTAEESVTIEQADDRLRVLIGGSLFTEYIFRGHSRPILFPIIGPHGQGMTRSYPVKMGVAGESHDHPHHKPMFFAHGWVNSVNFFAEFDDSGKTVHDKLLKVQSGSPRGLIRTSNKWMAQDGKIICTDTRTLYFQAVPGGRAIDWEVTLHASHGDVMFRDEKHGIMAIRMHPNLRLDNDPERGVTTAKGQAVNSEGVSGKAVFGKRARWIDYWGEIDDKSVGIAIFDHPTNLRHPTWWMARGYGYVAADPFGAHAIGGEAPGTGDLLLKAGKEITFRYRFVFHTGDPLQAKVEELYRTYVETIAPKVSEKQ